MNSASRGGIPLGFLMRIVPSLQEETKEKDPKETLDGTHAYWSWDMEIDLNTVDQSQRGYLTIRCYSNRPTNGA